MAEFTEVVKAMQQNCDRIIDCDKCEIRRICGNCIFFGGVDNLAAQEHIALAVQALSVTGVTENDDDTN